MKFRFSQDTENKSNSNFNKLLLNQSKIKNINNNNGNLDSSNNNRKSSKLYSWLFTNSLKSSDPRYTKNSSFKKSLEFEKKGNIKKKSFFQKICTCSCCFKNTRDENNDSELTSSYNSKDTLRTIIPLNKAIDFENGKKK